MKIEGLNWDDPLSVRNTMIQLHLEVKELRGILKLAHQKIAELQSELHSLKHPASIKIAPRQK